jgi:hypothetical protein
MRYYNDRTKQLICFRNRIGKNFRDRFHLHLGHNGIQSSMQRDGFDFGFGIRLILAELKNEEC